MKISKYHNYRSVINARRAVSVLATLFVMLSLLTPMTVHAENCSVAFGSGQYEAEKGETFSIGVYVKSDYGAASYSVIIRYDTEHLTYVDGADGADIASGALQLIGSGAETSIRRMIRFRANNTGNAVVYAESAEVYFVPLTQVFDEMGNPGVDEFGNLLVVPAGDPVMYSVAALASAPVTVKTPEETDNDQQADTDQNVDNNTDNNTETTQLDDNVADDNTDTQADQQDDGVAPATENPAGDDQAQENTETGDSGAAQATDSETEANDIWQTTPAAPSAPGEQTEKKTPFVFNTYFVIILVIIVIIAWVDIVFILSRRSESARRRREMELREAEEKEELEEEGLRFADIDEDDDAEENKPVMSNYKYRTLSSDGPTASLKYEDIDGELTDPDDPEDPMV